MNLSILDLIAALNRNTEAHTRWGVWATYAGGRQDFILDAIGRPRTFACAEDADEFGHGLNIKFMGIAQWEVKRA